MAKFRCKQSGNVFVFESEHDIKGLRKHPEYEEVIEEQEKQEEHKEAIKKQGRPKKEQ